MLLQSAPLKAVGDALDTWHLRYPVSAETSSNSLNAVTYGNGLFVVVGDRGKILTSRDGAVWTERDSGVRTNFHTVCSGNGVFVAGCDRFAGSSFGEFRNKVVSTDGIQWSVAPAEQYAADVWAIGFGNGMFVALSTYGGDGTETYSSVDGQTWSYRGFRTRGMTEIAFGAGRFSAGGSQLMSTDTSGSNGDFGWQNSYDVFPGVSGLCYGSGIFAATTDGAFSRESSTLTSTDGVTWSKQTLAAFYGARGIAFGNGQFVIAGWSGIMSCADALDWIPRPSVTPKHLNGICYGRGTFVAVGDAGTILQSGFAGSPILEIDQNRQIAVTGQEGEEYTLQGSIDLTSWTNLWGFVGGTTALSYSETNAPETRFYRVVNRASN